MERGDFRILPEEECFGLRKRAIALLKSGMKQYEVAAIIGTKKETISKWHTLYERDRLKGLQSKKVINRPEDKKNY